MKLTIQDIEKIADLARLEIPDGQKKIYADDLTAVFSFMDMLNEVDTTGVPETCQVTGLQDVVRDDVVVPADPKVRQKLIAAFPQHEANLLKVQAVFKEAKK